MSDDNVLYVGIVLILRDNSNVSFDIFLFEIDNNFKFERITNI